MPRLRRQLLIAAALTCGAVGVADASAAPPRPDLAVSSVRVSRVATLGGPLQASARVVNRGRKLARPTSVAYFLSLDRRLAQGDVRLPAQRLPALRSGRSANRLVGTVVPRWMRRGSYLLIACVDEADRIAESVERNNCARSSHRVSIAPQPAAPVITSRPAEHSSSATAQFAFDGAGAFECRIDAAPFTACSSPVGYSQLSEQRHVFHVRARDRDGRMSPVGNAEWNVDLTAPATPALRSAPSGLTNTTTATLEFTLEGGSAALCSLDGAAPGSCASPHTVAGLADGPHTLRVQARDAAGNESGAAGADWRVDATPPPAPQVTERAPAQTYVRSARFNFTSAEAGASVTCRLDGGSSTPCEDSRVFAGPLRPGDHVFTVTARDEAGNDSATSAAWTILARADGIYGGSGGQTPVAEFEAWRGSAPAGRVLEYLRMATWNDIEGGGSPDILARWRGSSYQLVLSTPMLTASGATLTEGALGLYDSHFQALAERLVAEGQGGATIRLGWEFNGDWYPWSAGPNPEAFKLFWRRIVTTMRSVPGARFTFDWCANSGPSRSNAELAYPGDAYVDFIGLSAFDAAWGAPDPPTPEWRWDTILNQVHGLVWQRDFARAHVKPMTYPEWGLWTFTDPGYYAGGGSDGKDDPYYIERMFEWFNANEVAYALYFQFDSPVGLHKLTTGSFPLGMARYKALFGSL